MQLPRRRIVVILLLFLVTVASILMFQTRPRPSVADLPKTPVAPVPVSLPSAAVINQPTNTTASSPVAFQASAQGGNPNAVPTSLKRGPNNRLLLDSARDLPRHIIKGKISDEVVMKVRPGPLAGSLTMDEHTISAVEADYDIIALKVFLNSDAQALRFPLTAAREVVVDVDNVISRGEFTQTLVGKVQDDPFSDVLITFHDGAVSGSIAFHNSNTHYEYAMAGNGDIAIRRLDPDTFNAPCGDPGEAPADETTGQASLPADGVGEAANEPPAGSLVIDTVVGYDKAARIAQGGVAAMESKIINSVDRMNTALSNSQVGAAFISLLAMIEDPDYVFPGNQSGNMGEELDDLNSHGDGKLDTVSQLRIDLGADQNSFVVKQADGSAGIAFRPGRSMIVARDYMTSTRITFSHEFGHNIGCRHSWGDDTANDPVNVHNYGWRLDPPSSARVRTIMAYDWDWGSGARIPYYSNPNVSYNGAKTGAPNGYDATGDATADQRYVSGGLVGNAGSGFDGTHPSLGARNADYITANAGAVADNATRKSLAVLDPVAGISWANGQTNIIFWRGGDHTDTAVLALYKGGVFQFNITNGISAENRWYPWGIPANQAAGSDYKIRVTLNGTSFAESSNFTIGLPPAVVIDSPSTPIAALSSVSQRLVLAATTTPGSGGGSPTWNWSKVSGPGTASFENASQEDTTVTFSSTGLYVLRLTANQGGLAGSADVAVNVNASVANTSLALRYAFDQSSGTSVPDSSGNGNNGSISGTPSWVAGQLGNAVRFTSSSTYADSASGVAINDASGVTASAWVRLDQAASNNRHIIRQNDGGGTGRSWLYVAADGNLNSFIGNGTTTGGQMPLNEWHHVAFTAGSGKVVLFFDGQPIATNNLAVETCSGVIRIGQTKTPSSGFQWLGSVDDARVYQRVLSTDEVKILAAYNNGPVVDAGPDANAFAGVATTAAGGSTDDGKPNPPAIVTYQWTQLSGPTNAIFSNSTNAAGGITFPSAGTYMLRLIAGDGSIQTADDVVWTVTNLPPAEQWRLTYFGTTENTGNSADAFDYDNDGVLNVFERAFGTVPTNAASVARPTYSLVDATGAPGSDYFAISYPRLAGGTPAAENGYAAQGITYTLESASQLAYGWSANGFVLLGVSPPINGIETATFRLGNPVSSNTMEFISLKLLTQ